MTSSLDESRPELFRWLESHGVSFSAAAKPRPLSIDMRMFQAGFRRSATAAGSGAELANRIGSMMEEALDADSESEADAVYSALLEEIPATSSPIRASVSLLRILAEQECSQKVVVSTMLERMPILASECGESRPFEQVLQTVKDLVASLRWMDVIVDGKHQCELWLQLLSVCPPKIQAVLIDAFAEIIDVEFHEQVIPALKEVLESSTQQLAVPICDTLTNLQVGDAIRSMEIYPILNSTLSSASFSDVPALVRITLTADTVDSRLLGFVANMRSSIHIASIAPPANDAAPAVTMSQRKRDKQPRRSLSSVTPNARGGGNENASAEDALVLALRTVLSQRPVVREAVYNSILKDLKSKQSLSTDGPASQFRVLDLWLIWLMMDLSQSRTLGAAQAQGQKKLMDVWKRAILQKAIVPSLLVDAIVGHECALASMFNAILGSGASLLNTADERLRAAGQELLFALFRGFTGSYHRQTLLNCLLGICTTKSADSQRGPPFKVTPSPEAAAGQWNAISGFRTKSSTNSANAGKSSLELLIRLTTEFPHEMEPHRVLLTSLWDHVEQFGDAEVRLFYRLIVRLAYLPLLEAIQSGAPLSTTLDNRAKSELFILLRKELTHATPSYIRLGVIGTVALVEFLGTLPSDLSSPDIVNEALEMMRLIARRSSGSINTLFYDELSESFEHEPAFSSDAIVGYVQREFTSDFESKYVVDLPSQESGHMSQRSITGTEVDEARCWLNIDGEEAPICLNIGGWTDKIIHFAASDVRPTRRVNESHAFWSFPAHFRLLSRAERKVHHDLSEIDALLGCPVLLYNPEEVQKAGKMDITFQSRIVMAVLMSVNWMRETISAFSKEPTDGGYLEKILCRVQNLVRMEAVLARLLRECPHVDVLASLKDKVQQPVLFGKDKDEDDFKEKKGGKRGKGAQTDTASIGSALKGLSAYLRPLDMSVHRLLYIGDADNDNYSMQFSDAAFLLNDLHDKLVASAAHDGVRQQLVEFVMEAIPQYPALLAKLKESLDDRAIAIGSDEDASQVVLSEGGEANSDDPTLEDVGLTGEDAPTQQAEMFPDDESYVGPCWIAVFEVVASLVNPATYGLTSSDAADSEEFTRVLFALSKAFCNGLACEPRSGEDVPTLASKLALSLSAFWTPQIGYDGTLAYVEAQLVLLGICQSKTTKPRVEVATQIASLFASKAVYDSHRLKTGANVPIGTIVRLVEAFIEIHVAPLDVLRALLAIAHSRILSKDADAEEEDSSFDFVFLTEPIFSKLYKSLFHCLRLQMKKISLNTKGNAASSSSAKDVVEKIRMCSTVFAQLIEYTKRLDRKAYYLSAVKTGRYVLDELVRMMPFLTDMFPRAKDGVVKILKNFQAGTRQLQYLCNESKVEREKSLLSTVPYLKKVLESIIYQVKYMFQQHGCIEAFWQGNLKHRDRRGREVSSQVPTGDGGDSESEIDEDNASDGDDADATTDNATESRRASSQGSQRSRSSPRPAKRSRVQVSDDDNEGSDTDAVEVTEVDDSDAEDLEVLDDEDAPGSAAESAIELEDVDQTEPEDDEEEEEEEQEPRRKRQRSSFLDMEADDIEDDAGESEEEEYEF